jgi:hypothetical protein
MEDNESDSSTARNELQVCASADLAIRQPGRMDECNEEIANTNTVSKSSFHRIISRLTSGGARSRKAVDYVSGFLVNDTFDVITQMINAPTVGNKDAARMTEMLERVRIYLKYGFDYHVKDPTIECRLRLLNHGLSKPNEAVGFVVPVCYMCLQAFSTFEQLKTLLSGHVSDQSLQHVLSDCSNKAKLYLAHRVRVINQQMAIAQVVQDIRADCAVSGCCSKALVVVDFKMKQEPMYFREKTVEHYGKRGISWHGAMIQHLVYDNVQKEWIDERL